MFARINTTTRSKPVLVVPPAPSGSASIPGMLTPPQITQDGDDYLFADGAYAGAVSRTRAYLLDGVNVSGRVTGGRFTPAANEVGRLLAFLETVTGSGGSIARQASVVVRPGAPPITQVDSDTVISSGARFAA